MIRVNLHERLGQRARPMPRWAAWLAMAGSLVVGVTLFLLAASLALIVIPIALIAGSIALWRLRARLKAAGFGAGQPFDGAARAPGRVQPERVQPDRVDVIDADYRIVEPDEPPRR